MKTLARLSPIAALALAAAAAHAAGLKVSSPDIAHGRTLPMTTTLLPRTMSGCLFKIAYRSASVAA